MRIHWRFVTQSDIDKTDDYALNFLFVDVLRACYREDVFTDRRLGTIRHLMPVTADGAPDATRPVLFVGQAQIVTPGGLLPLSFEIEGTSLAEAIRKYQTPDAAQPLVSYTAQNGANRDRLQRYIVNLAAEREHDLQIMDREAQRCRGILTEVPSKAGKRK